jgi:hypothetical protein
MIAVVLAADADFMKNDSKPPTKGNQMSNAGKLSNAANIINSFVYDFQNNWKMRKNMMETTMIKT